MWWWCWAFYDFLSHRTINSPSHASLPERGAFKGILPRLIPLVGAFFWRKTNRFSDYVFADKPFTGFVEILCENNFDT